MRKIILLILSISFVCIGDVYWVSPTGAATWANSKSATPLSGTLATTLTLANSNAIAGDTIYLRDGTYTFTGDAIAPSNSGSAIFFNGNSSGNTVKNNLIYSHWCQANKTGTKYWPGIVAGTASAIATYNVANNTLTNNFVNTNSDTYFSSLLKDRS